MSPSGPCPGAAAAVLTARAPTRPVTAGSSGTPTARSPRSSSMRTRQPEQRAIDEINSGMYAFDGDLLADAVKRVRTDNAKVRNISPRAGPSCAATATPWLPFRVMILTRFRASTTWRSSLTAARC